MQPGIDPWLWTELRRGGTGGAAEAGAARPIEYRYPAGIRRGIAFFRKGVCGTEATPTADAVELMLLHRPTFDPDTAWGPS